MQIIAKTKTNPDTSGVLDINAAVVPNKEVVINIIGTILVSAALIHSICRSKFFSRKLILSFKFIWFLRAYHKT
ncbi:MAG: hypothetical protein KAR84_08160 [Elusimicrobiales bacterium]|nr:hypothetical protein [Elusimicrobiales bacterium]